MHEALVSNLRSLADTPGDTRYLRIAAHLAADKLEEPREVKVVWLRSWPHAGLGFLIGVSLAIALHFTVFAPGYSCHSFKGGAFTCLKK